MFEVAILKQHVTMCAKKVKYSDKVKEFRPLLYMMVCCLVIIGFLK